MIRFKCVALPGLFPLCDEDAGDKLRWETSPELICCSICFHGFCSLMKTFTYQKAKKTSVNDSYRREWLAMWELSWVERMGNRANMFTCQSLWHATTPKKFNEHVGRALRTWKRCVNFCAFLAIDLHGVYLIGAAQAILIAQTAWNVINLLIPTAIARKFLQSLLKPNRANESFPPPDETIFNSILFTDFSFTTSSIPLAGFINFVYCVQISFVIKLACQALLRHPISEPIYVFVRRTMQIELDFYQLVAVLRRTWGVFLDEFYMKRGGSWWGAWSFRIKVKHFLRKPVRRHSGTLKNVCNCQNPMLPASSLDKKDHRAQKSLQSVISGRYRSSVSSWIIY